MILVRILHGCGAQPYLQTVHHLPRKKLTQEEWKQLQGSNPEPSLKAQKDVTTGPNRFPCASFECLLDKFEVMRTSNGYLLNKIPQRADGRPSAADESPCKNLACWLQKFNLKSTSYGYELSFKENTQTPENSEVQKFGAFMTKLRSASQSTVSHSEISSRNFRDISATTQPPGEISAGNFRDNSVTTQPPSEISAGNFRDNFVTTQPPSEISSRNFRDIFGTTSQPQIQSIAKEFHRDTKDPNHQEFDDMFDDYFF